jgi:type VI secretion system protein ImpM
MSARLFGKLPAHGDFVARGLGAAEREALDAWLSVEMLAAREKLGADFEHRYDRAPPWRFAGPDGVGMLVASVDGVGRRFPLYLALAGAGEDAAERVEELVYRAFGERWDADTLCSEVCALDFAGGDAPARARWWTLGGEGFAPASLDGERPEGLLANMLISEVNA